MCFLKQHCFAVLISTLGRNSAHPTLVFMLPNCALFTGQKIKKMSAKKFSKGALSHLRGREGSFKWRERNQSTHGTRAHHLWGFSNSTHSAAWKRK